MKPRKRRPSNQSSNRQIDKAITRAQKLMHTGRRDEAIELLERLRDSAPREPRIHVALGVIWTDGGDMWQAMKAFEQAILLTNDPQLLIPLGISYMENELYGLALHSFRRSLDNSHLDPAAEARIRQVVVDLEQDVATLAQHLHLPLHEVERGLFYLAEGNRALRDGAYEECASANRAAAKLLGDWPPPWNNLSVALFFEGEPDEAIATGRRVLAHDPRNVHATSNLIRFLSWSGQESHARQVWEHLRLISPSDPDTVNKIVEAAMILGDDETVYDLLHRREEHADEALTQREELSLAVAAANLGRREGRWRLERLSAFFPVVETYLTALKAGRPGPGLASRFPYTSSFDMLPHDKMLKFIDLVKRQSDESDETFHRDKGLFLKAYPQLEMVAEKLIWEEDNVEAGVGILLFLATPAAHAALRRFGLSQAGDDKARMDVLFRLAEAGQIEPDSSMRVWLRGKWREVQIPAGDNPPAPAQQLSSQVLQLLDQAQAAFDADDLERTEALLQETLRLDPTVAVAWSNLGLLHIVRQETDQAKEMWRKAVALDPMAVKTRCHLASLHLQEGDVEGAEACIRPLNKLTRWEPRELAQFQVLRARIMVENDDYEGAASALDLALEVDPDYTPAVDLLTRLRASEQPLDFFTTFQEKMERNWRAARRRLQKKLTIPDPTLAQVLPLYTRDVLDRMARNNTPREDRRSGLRKAELVELNQRILTSRDTIQRLVAGLSEVERNAMREVLGRGGVMPWVDFDRLYGNDGTESPYWHWHAPQTTMGRLRACILLAEASVNGELLLVVPIELRDMLSEILM